MCLEHRWVTFLIAPKKASFIGFEEDGYVELNIRGSGWQFCKKAQDLGKQVLLKCKQKNRDLI